MVTIRRLAELAGVSNMTVWCALHGKPGVSAQVRARILALAETHHYHANRLVEGLISGTTRTIGYVSLGLKVAFYARVCEGAIEAASHDQVHVITFHLQGKGLSELQPLLPQLIAQLIEQRVDGIILFCGGFTVPRKSVLEMWSHDIVPVLICDTLCEKPLDRIDTDEEKLANLAIDYLVGLGHRRIAYCGYNGRHTRDWIFYQTFQARGLSHDCFTKDTCLTMPNHEQTDAYLTSLLRKSHPPTAIICFEDHIAIQLLERTQRHGMRIPADLEYPWLFE